MPAPQILVILSGCGLYDGAEIHESVISLLALARAGAEATIAAPNIDQRHVIDHSTGEVVDERRNVLVEAARIARGKILDLSTVSAQDYDGVFLPGGFGAAKNLCTFATEGADCSIQPEVQRVLQEFHAASKPIGAVCIAPAVVVRALGGVCVTIGSDPGTASALEAMGGSHITQAVTECHVDTASRVVTAPAYMVETSIDQVALGIEAAVCAVLELTEHQSG
jgi:enhancing lycopene biosynthesis protein 2